jgi:hypothetical protein
MSTTRTVNGRTYHVACNNIPRELVCFAELPEGVADEWFDYLPRPVTDDEDWSPRFVQYRGSWYDVHEFEPAGDDLRALGFDGVQTESYFSAVALRYFDRDGVEYDDAVVVGYIHW